MTLSALLTLSLSSISLSFFSLYTHEHPTAALSLLSHALVQNQKSLSVYIYHTHFSSLSINSTKQNPLPSSSSWELSCASMAFPILIFSLFFLLLCFCSALLRWNQLRYSKNGLPPGTMGWPVFGETTEFLKQGPNFMKTQRARYYFCWWWFVFWFVGFSVFTLCFWIGMGAFSSLIFWGVLRLFLWIQRLIDMFWWTNQKGLSLVTLNPCLIFLANAISPPFTAALTNLWELLWSLLLAPPWLKIVFFLKLMTLFDPIWGIGIAKSLIFKTKLKRWTLVWKRNKFAILLCFYSGFFFFLLCFCLQMALRSSLKQIAGIESGPLSESFIPEFFKLVLGTLSLPIDLPGTNYRRGIQVKHSF